METPSWPWRWRRVVIRIPELRLRSGGAAGAVEELAGRGFPGSRRGRGLGVLEADRLWAGVALVGLFLCKVGVFVLVCEFARGSSSSSRALGKEGSAMPGIVPGRGAGTGV